MSCRCSVLSFSAAVFVTIAIALVQASKECPKHPPPTATSVFSLRRSIPPTSASLAKRYLEPPKVFALLFSNSIASLRKVTPSFYRISHDDRTHASLQVQKKKKGLTVFRIKSHSLGFFPVSLKGSTIVVRLRTGLKTPVLEIAFRGAVGLQRANLRARNVYARALVSEMMIRSRYILGMHQCSGAIAEYSGHCNNVRHPMYGAAPGLQLRPKSSKRMSLSTALPNPRAISNIMCRENTADFSPNKASFLFVIFGQFLDHDIILTPSGGHGREEASFAVPSARDENNRRMRFFRSDVLALPSCCDASYTIKRQKSSGPFNAISSFIDGSAIYGSDYIRAFGLRSFRNGKLILRKHNGQRLLPRNSDRHLLYTLDNANRKADQNLFVAGDVRANENPALTAIHTVFAREHNRVCNLLRKSLRKAKKPNQSDEWLFQQARRIVVAELQCIVYREFIPVMLGNRPLPAYRRYNPRVDASMNILFTTSAYRWGHSAIRNEIFSQHRNGHTKKIPLERSFFNPKKFADEGLEAWLRGGMKAPAMNVDLAHADSIRDFLFHPGKRGVLDLVALNIQRGRDHELPSYTHSRGVYGLSQDLQSIPPQIRKVLLQVYGKAENIDSFIGGLAEVKVPGAVLGPLFHRVVAEQFMRLRDGDRFYYENVRWGSFLSRLRIVRRIKSHRCRLADIIEKNTNISRSQIPSRRGVMFTI